MDAIDRSVVEQWYADAEELLLRARAAVYWRHNLQGVPRNSIHFYGDPTQDEINQLFRAANQKADDACDAIESEIVCLEVGAFEIGKRFDVRCIELFYLELKSIEIENLHSGRCASVPLQDLCYTIRNWGRELIHLNRTPRSLNCGETVDWMDRERWVGKAVDLIRERLLLERLTIKKNLPSALLSVNWSNSQPIPKVVMQDSVQGLRAELLELERIAPMLSVLWNFGGSMGEAVSINFSDGNFDMANPGHAGRLLALMKRAGQFLESSNDVKPEERFLLFVIGEWERLQLEPPGTPAATIRNAAGVFANAVELMGVIERPVVIIPDPPIDGIYPDEKCLIWGGKRYDMLTPKMVAVLSYMVERYQNGFPNVSVASIRQAIQDKAIENKIDGAFISQVFKLNRKGGPNIHPVASVIERIAAGEYRLIDPQKITS